MGNKFQICKRDPLNWTVEEWIPPGPAKRGRYAGQETKGRWAVRSYHTTLENAALAMLDDALPDGTACKDIIQAIHNAQEQVKEAIREHARNLERPNAS